MQSDIHRGKVVPKKLALIQKSQHIGAIIHAFNHKLHHSMPSLDSIINKGIITIHLRQAAIETEDNYIVFEK